MTSTIQISNGVKEKIKKIGKFIVSEFQSKIEIPRKASINFALRYLNKPSSQEVTGKIPARQRVNNPEPKASASPLSFLAKLVLNSARAIASAYVLERHWLELTMPGKTTSNGLRPIFSVFQRKTLFEVALPGILQPKKNNQERIQSIKLIQEENTKNTILFSISRDFLAERGRLRRKAKREARRKRKRKNQGKKKTHFAFIKTTLCDGLRLEAC